MSNSPRNRRVLLEQSSSSDFSSPQHEHATKKKTNKYAKFSKVEISHPEWDPLEALINESKKKLQELEEAKERQRRQKSKFLPPTDSHQTKQDHHHQKKRLEFPDNKEIDPYDPTTFGYVEIGTILGPHGVHGWTKVQGCTDFPERLTRPGMLLHMKPPRKRAPRKVTLSMGKCTGPDFYLIQLQGTHNRTEAQKLKGYKLYYATQQDTVVQENDLLISDLVGLQVRLLENADTIIGTVEGIVLAEEMCVIPGLGHDMLEVMITSTSMKKDGETNGNPQLRYSNNTPKKLVLIPFVPEIVPKVDLSKQRILINPPAGLLDLTYEKEEKVRIRGFLPPARD